MSRRLILLVALLAASTAHASPTRAQVRAAIAPAFRARPISLCALAVTAAADVLTTETAINQGCREGNPIYGSHPSLPLLIGTHAAIVGGALVSGTPAWANFTTAALFGFAAIHNANVRCQP